VPAAGSQFEPAPLTFNLPNIQKDAEPHVTLGPMNSAFVTGPINSISSVYEDQNSSSSQLDTHVSLLYTTNSSEQIL